MTTLDFMMELHDLTTGSVDIAISELLTMMHSQTLRWSGWHGTLLLRYSFFFFLFFRSFLSSFTSHYPFYTLTISFSFVTIQRRAGRGN